MSSEIVGAPDENLFLQKGKMMMVMFLFFAISEGIVGLVLVSIVVFF